jgi:hypothetical protein
MKYQFSVKNPSKSKEKPKKLSAALVSAGIIIRQGTVDTNYPF